MKIMKKMISQEDIIEQITEEIKEVQKKSSDKEINNTLEKIKKQLNCLV